MRPFNEKRFHEVVTEIAQDCSCNGGYCFFRELITHQHPDLRMLIQVECLEKFKYVISEKHQKDVGRHVAGQMWVDYGFAKKFAEVYNEDLTVREIFHLTMQHKPEQPQETVQQIAQPVAQEPNSQ